MKYNCKYLSLDSVLLVVFLFSILKYAFFSIKLILDKDSSVISSLYRIFISNNTIFSSNKTKASYFSKTQDFMRIPGQK